MRLQMAAQQVAGGPPSPVAITRINDGTIDIASYIALGYTNYDVVCIGGAGGHGGGINPVGIWDGGVYAYRAYGGAPGGGGAHRVQGLLSSLPSTVNVVVGSRGDNAYNVYSPYDYYLLGTGSPGGTSSFNGSTCKASGGAGGDPAYFDEWNSISYGGAGGSGGLGNSTVPGGGGVGGTPETIGDAGSNATAGGWNGAVGGGGGGGGGGTAQWDNYTVLYYPYIGAYGQFGGDYLFSAPGGDVRVGDNNDEFENWREDTGAYIFESVVPGCGGGATANQVNGSSITYGSRVDGAYPYGCVAVRFT